MKEFLIYMIIGLVLTISQTWWYPKHIGWSRVLGIWLVGGLVAAILASIIRFLPFRQERYKDQIAILIVAAVAATVAGLTRGLWVGTKP